MHLILVILADSDTHFKGAIDVTDTVPLKLVTVSYAFGNVLYTSKRSPLMSYDSS